MYCSVSPGHDNKNPESIAESDLKSSGCVESIYGDSRCVESRLIPSANYSETPSEEVEYATGLCHSVHVRNWIITKRSMANDGLDSDSNLLVKHTDTRPVLTAIETLAKVPEEEVWLAKQKAPRTRQAYRQDVQHFLRTVGITSLDELRRIDHRAIIAWERYMREAERVEASTIRRRLAALSSLFKHLVRHGEVERNPVSDIERPNINRDEGSTLAHAEQSERAALAARDEAEAVTEFLSETLASADPGQQGKDVTVRERRPLAIQFAAGHSNSSNNPGILETPIRHLVMTKKGRYYALKQRS